MVEGEGQRAVLHEELGMVAEGTVCVSCGGDTSLLNISCLVTGW